jgi:copper transport protein
MVARGQGNFQRWKKVSYLLYGMGALGLLLEVIADRVELFQAPTKDFMAFSFVWIALLQLLLLSLGYWLLQGKFRLTLLILSVALWAFIGHAASPSYGGFWGIGVDIVHLLAVSLWMGGLLALFIMIPKEGAVSWLKEFGKIYSKWAFCSMIVIGTTGVWMALKYVPSFTMSSMAESHWGQMLFIKIILFAVIVIFGFVQRKSLMRIAQNFILFITRVKIELVTAGIVLLAAAILIDLSPKEAVQGIYPKKVIQNEVEAKVDITPFQLGANDITISFQNEPEFNKVRVKLWAAPSWSVENTAFPLGDGKYRLTGNFLHGAGGMNIEVQATKANGEIMAFPFKVQVPGAQDTGSE